MTTTNVPFFMILSSVAMAFSGLAFSIAIAPAQANFAEKSEIAADVSVEIGEATFLGESTVDIGDAHIHANDLVVAATTVRYPVQVESTTMLVSADDVIAQWNSAKRNK